jgi:NADH-quinone oxidoreductase subunit A
VEVAFLYPVTVVFRDWVARGQGLFALAEVSIFLGILFVGLVYVWVKRDLEWLKKVRTPEVEPDSMREAA